MSDLTKKQPSTSAALAEYRRNLAKTAGTAVTAPPQTDLVFLLDCSGSMKTVERGRTRMAHLRTAVRSIAQDHLGATFLAFGSDVGGYYVRECSPETIPTPHGATPMGLAFKQARKIGAKQIVMISDGCPDDTSLALASARTCQGARIDVVFVGSEWDAEAIDFMNKLAALGGGTMSVRALNRTDLPSLEQTIRKLLP